MFTWTRSLDLQDIAHVLSVKSAESTGQQVRENRIIRASDYIAANSPGGSNEQKHSQAVLVFLFTYWEEEIRPRLATIKGVELQEISSDIMGDLRTLRHTILHTKGMMRSEKHRGLRKLSGMFVVDQPVHVSYENMHQIFVLIKQECARMLFEWLGIKDAPIQPDEILDLAIQKKSKTVL